MQVATTRITLAAARNRVRMAGHLHLGVQTGSATSSDAMVESIRLGAALAEHVKSSWTADSFLNINYTCTKCNHSATTIY